MTWLLLLEKICKTEAGGKCNRQLCKLLPFCQDNWKRKIWEDGALKCPTYTESQFRLPILDTPLSVILESLASKIHSQKCKREQKMSFSRNLPHFSRPQLGVADGQEIPTEFCHEKNIVGCKLENKRQHWKHHPAKLQVYTYALLCRFSLIISHGMVKSLTSPQKHFNNKLWYFPQWIGLF